jgi:hypothetical protein
MGGAAMGAVGETIRALADSRFMRTLLWSSVGVAVLLAFSGVARQGLSRDPRFIVQPDSVRARLPEWADPELDDDVNRRLRALGPLSLLDRQFESKVRGALEGCPVVDRVRSVRRQWPRSYSVEIIYRRPAVVIERAGERIPMTWDGVRLPADAYPEAARLLYPIRGVLGDLPELGQRLVSEAFADGVATLQQIAPYLGELKGLDIQAIDVGEVHHANRGVILRTRSSIDVRWGRPRAPVGENSVETKIHYLLAAQGRMSTLKGFRIDVRFDQPYVRELPSP